MVDAADNLRLNTAQRVIMNFLKYEFDTEPGELIQVTLNIPANVRLLDWSNFQKYENGQYHTYHGGHASASPVRLRPPHAGHWYVVIDLGGYPGRLRALAEKINPPQRQTA